MHATIERKRRSRVNFKIVITEHTELKDRDEIVINFSLQSDLCGRGGFTTRRIEDVRRYRGNQPGKGTIGNRDHAGGSIRILDDRLIWSAIRFREREALRCEF